MFGVYRDQRAMAPLQATWELADDARRRDILLALQGTDEQLQREPHLQGESRQDGSRILFQAPLAVLFTVDDSRALVHILRTWAYTDRPRPQHRAA